MLDSFPCPVDTIHCLKYSNALATTTKSGCCISPLSILGISGNKWVYFQMKPK